MQKHQAYKQHTSEKDGEEGGKKERKKEEEEEEEEEAMEGNTRTMKH